MDTAELIGRLEQLLKASKVGILTTIDAGGYPHSRWMTPTILKGRPNFIYAVTAPDSPKALQLQAHPQVEWTFQNTVLSEIFSVLGTSSLVASPQAKAEVLEAIGPHLQIFWRGNENSRNLVVIESEMQSISCFLPLKNEYFHSELR